ncbi:MAG: DUF3541 domain-containing protein [Candidatus Kerfeldbacteria bacterium]|nr:DUF3541 domain-containing protein [Candidatus Kerfeldbacteria bacterium]
MHSAISSKRILDIYNRNCASLPLDNLAHFAYRAYKVTGEEQYKKIIAFYFFLVKQPRIVADLALLKTGQFSYTRHYYYKKFSERRKKREDLYQQQPKLQFFDRFIHHLFFIQKYGLHMTMYAQQYPQLLSQLSLDELRTLYINEEAIRYNSSFTFNTLAFLKHIHVSSALFEEAQQLFRKIYFNASDELVADLTDDEYHSVIYSMTHIILADTQYYEHDLPGQYEWIIMYFANHIEEIRQRTDIDTLIEVALCMKLCHFEVQYAEAWAMLQSVVDDYISFETLETDAEYRAIESHTYALLILLFFTGATFFSGPDLSRASITE